MRRRSDRALRIWNVNSRRTEPSWRRAVAIAVFLEKVVNIRHQVDVAEAEAAAREEDVDQEEEEDESSFILRRAQPVRGGGAGVGAQRDGPTEEELEHKYDSPERAAGRANEEYVHIFAGGAGAQGAGAGAAAAAAAGAQEEQKLHNLGQPTQQRYLWMTLAQLAEMAPYRTLRHGDRPRADLDESPRPESDWRGSVVDQECRGVASVYVEEQRAMNRLRYRGRHVLGYCRRNTCECCEQIPGPKGNWCGCVAVQDGLCRRCWLDFYCGIDSHKSEYCQWGPLALPQ